MAPVKDHIRSRPNYTQEDDHGPVWVLMFSAVLVAMSERDYNASSTS